MTATARTTTSPLAPERGERTRRRWPAGRALRAFVVNDGRLYLREPLLLAFSFGVPLLLAVGLGLPAYAREPDPALGGQRWVDALLPSLVLSLSLAMIGLFATPTFLAGYRETGMLRRLATTPASPLAVLVSQLVVSLAGALAAALLLLTVCWAGLGTRWPDRPLALAAGLLLGVAALMALGLVIAAVAPTAKGAAALAQLVMQPSCFLAGIYVPLQALPDWVAAIGRATPVGALRHVIENAQSGTGPVLAPLAILGVWTLAATGVARWIFRWQ